MASRAPPPGSSKSGRSPEELRGYFEAFLLAALVGVLGGLAAIGFRRLTDLTLLLWSGEAGTKLLEAAKRLAWWQALLIPAAGGLVATILVRLVFRRRGSTGMADIMETVSLRKGGIRL